MLELFTDPRLYLVLISAFITGFLETEFSWPGVLYECFATLAFYLGIALLIALIVTHGWWLGVLSAVLAWVVSLLGDQTCLTFESAPATGARVQRA